MAVATHGLHHLSSPSLSTVTGSRPRSRTTTLLWLPLHYSAKSFCSWSFPHSERPHSSVFSCSASSSSSSSSSPPPPSPEVTTATAESCINLGLSLFSKGRVCCCCVFFFSHLNSINWVLLVF